MATEKKQTSEALAENKEMQENKLSPKKTTARKTAAKKGSKKEVDSSVEEEKKFLSKLAALKQLAKTKRNVLELAEINSLFFDIGLDEEKTEKVIEFLEDNGVDVLRIPEGKETDEDITNSNDNIELPDDDIEIPLTDFIDSEPVEENTPNTESSASSVNTHEAEETEIKNNGE